ncbi:unnamed protein product [Dicrocoelium dendriticum]|nr:unnamed protein product [Dicrocoelium dendriticum]
MFLALDLYCILFSDQYKGWSDKNGAIFPRQKQLSDYPYITENKQKRRTRNFQCGVSRGRSKQTALNAEPNAPVLKTRKYFSSVSHTLRVLRNSTSDEETEDSTSDSEGTHEPSPTVFPHPLRGLEIPTPSEPRTPSEDFALDDVDLESELRNLGLPTSFGPVRESYTVAHIRNSVESISNDSDYLLLMTHIQNQMRPAKVIPRRSASLKRLFGETVNPPLRLHSSSENLSNFHNSVFRSWCSLLELSCDFTQPLCYALQQCSLNLAPAWVFADFNLHAFLYSCRSYWRYEVPSIAADQHTAALGSLQWESIRSDPVMSKYWSQRFRLFSRLNQGIQMDRDSFFSATPEAIAVHHALRLRHALSLDCDRLYHATVVDAFCGTGCSAIQFAVMGFHVVAVEIDPSRLAMAKHNAAVYGVESEIEFVCADFFVWAKSKLRDGSMKSAISTRDPYSAVFMSAPWGGPDYLNTATFDINCIQFGTACEEQHTFFHAVQLASQLALGRVILYMPRNTNMAQLHALSTAARAASLRVAEPSSTFSFDVHEIEVEANMLNFKLKSLTIYFGDLCNVTRSSAKPNSFPSPANHHSSPTYSNTDYCDDSDSSSPEYATALED